MQVVEIKEKAEWEGILDELNAPVSFFQSWNWGEFEANQGVKVWRLACFDLQLDNQVGSQQVKLLLAAAQIFLVTAKRGRYLHVRNGPVLKPGITKEQLSNVLQELKNLAIELRCEFIRISPLLENTVSNTQLLRSLGLTPSQMHDVDAEVTWLLNLEQDPEVILKDMRDSHRYLIRKSLKMTDLEIIKTADPKMVQEFWPIYEETFLRQKWTAYKLPYLIKEFETFAADGQVMLFLAKYQGKFIAGSMFIYYRGQVYYHHSGSLTAYRNVPAMYRIHWESIAEAKSRGIKTYNFFGIARDNDPKHPWAGLTLFKKGFGCQQQEWLHAFDFPVKLKYWFTHYYEKLERKKRGYQ